MQKNKSQTEKGNVLLCELCEVSPYVSSLGVHALTVHSCRRNINKASVPCGDGD